MKIGKPQLINDSRETEGILVMLPAAMDEIKAHAEGIYHGARMSSVSNYMNITLLIGLIAITIFMLVSSVNENLTFTKTQETVGLSTLLGVLVVLGMMVFANFFVQSNYGYNAKKLVNVSEKMRENSLTNIKNTKKIMEEVQRLRRMVYNRDPVLTIEEANVRDRFEEANVRDRLRKTSSSRFPDRFEEANVQERLRKTSSSRF